MTALASHGLEAATKADVKAIKEYLSEPFFVGGPQSGISHPGMRPKQINRMLDWESMVGRHHPDYTVDGEKSKYGGTGSATYELQKVGGVGQGVEFAKEKIWCWDTAEPGTGNLEKWIPGDCGEHHYSTAREANVVGAAPDSEAAELLGKGHYEWDDDKEWYVIVD